MKKFIIIATLALVSTLSYGQGTATPTMKFFPLMNGYNVLVQTNITVGVGVTNTLFTLPNGQIVHSLTNDVINGTLNTNSVSPDAFKLVRLAADANGDIVANASVVISVGNTNLIPIAVTNSVGQWYTSNSWPLLPANFNAWMYPATTNTYPVIGGDTNVLTITLYKAPSLTFNGASTGPSIPLWDTTSGFSFVVTMNGASTVTVNTNLPTGWLQGAGVVKATISTSGFRTNDIVNILGIVQPQP